MNWIIGNRSCVNLDKTCAFSVESEENGFYLFAAMDKRIVTVQGPFINEDDAIQWITDRLPWINV